MYSNTKRILCQFVCCSLFSQFAWTLPAITLRQPPTAFAILSPMPARVTYAIGIHPKAGTAACLRPADEKLLAAQPGTPDSPHRTFLQWSGMRGPRLQIFIDSGQKSGARYRGVTPDLAADLMLQIPGDGSVQMMRYAGSGVDWEWKAIEVHAVLTQTSQGSNRVEFDAGPLAPPSAAKIAFRFLDKSWNATSSSKVLSWRPN